MNILVVHNYYQVPGGEDTVVANEKKLLEENGHKVILYSRNNNELKKMSIFRKFFLPLTTIFSLKTYRDIKRLIKQEHIDIVHVHNTLSLISPSVYYAALKCKVPVVQTIHNFRLLCPAATFYRDGHICEDCVTKGFKCAIKHNCYRKSKIQTFICVINLKIHRLTKIYKKINYICLTEFNKEKLLQFKQIKQERVFVKPNFVLSNSQEIIPYDKRPDQFIFVGRLDKLKGIDILLNAWKTMGDKAPKLIICGIGPLEEWCKNYVKNNSLNSVELLGHVDNCEVKKYIAHSKALILPTQWYEGFPMTIVEAYSVGTPVVGAKIGNVGSLIDNGISGYSFASNDADSLKKVILNLDIIGNDQIKTLFSEKYSQQTNYSKLIEIYNSTLERNI